MLCLLRRRLAARAERDEMDLSKIPAGRNPPSDIHALIEIPIGGVPVKYEMDKASGTLFVDRFLHTAMFYPGNYGFIPQTLSEDGDPLDILVLAPAPVVPGAVVRCRPVGALVMKDQAGLDEKVLAVPVDALHPFYTGIRSYQDLPIILRQQVSHFFQHYKDLEKGKWTKIGDWIDVKASERLIVEAIERAAADKGHDKPAASKGKRKPKP
jgi:inorganic pyrophosphatase